MPVTCSLSLLVYFFYLIKEKESGFDGRVVSDVGTLKREGVVILRSDGHDKFHGGMIQELSTPPLS